MNYNVPKHIEEKTTACLHRTSGHPIEVTKRLVFDYFGDDYFKKDDLSPYVSIENNFDKLLVSPGHPSRQPTDTYYAGGMTVLRTHMTAHLPEMLGSGKEAYLVCGDCYRKDAIDRTHYPVFHQIDGAKVTKNNPSQELGELLFGLLKKLFPGAPVLINKDYFPFTDASLEMSVDVKAGAPMEILGAGVVKPEIMEACGLTGKAAWAFGMGLERLAMLLFGIHDIRQFWSKDPRFTSQFTGEVFKFKPYSKAPACYKDVSFWVTPQFNYNEMCEIVRHECGDHVESIVLLDTFHKDGQCSFCYRINYCHSDRSLTNEEADKLHDSVRGAIVGKFGVVLR